MFDLPSIVSQDLALRCGMQIYGENKVEINARVELLRRIRQLELAMAEVRNGLGRTLSSLYLKVRSPNPDEWTQITITEAAKIIAPDAPLDFLTLFAVHKYMMDHPKEFVADSVQYRSTQTFHLRPKSHVDRLEKVLVFAHQEDGPIQAFAPRARKIIDENRQRAKKSWAEPHSEHPRDREVFTPEDGIIIDFLRDTMRAARYIQGNPYTVSVSKIVKTIGRYEGAVGESTVYELLTDLGVLAPWQDVASTERAIGFDQEPKETSPVVAAQNAIVEKGYAKLATKSAVNGEVFGPEDFYTHDSLDSIRHDFGDMPVYVIDDPGAEELDDGISVEKIPSEPDNIWIHVHIADPTAVLPPTHVFAQQAREKVASAYFVHRTWPMLPSSVMGTLLPSVGDVAATGKPERVMSFSFKVDETGVIVDYHVRAGIVRNVHRTTYGAVNRAIGLMPYQPDYPFGGQPTPSSVVDLNEQQKADILVLKEAVDRMFKYTLQLPIFGQHMPISEITLSPKPLYASPVGSLKPPIFRGFPSLTYAVHTKSSYHQGAGLLVSQSMTAASRIASRWALDHGIPLLRRSSAQPLTLSDNDYADLLASKDEVGIASFVATLMRNVITPSALYTVEPAVHWALGIPEGEGYCRVTSPLRRHSDMVAHWQIKHALLHPKSSKPFFSSEWLGEYGRDLIAREKAQKRILKSSHDFWALQFIKRWTQNPARPEGPDPLANLVGYSTTTGVVNMVKNDVQCKFILPELGLRAFLTDLGDTHTSDVTSGEKYEVRIKELRLSANSQLLLKRR